MGDTDNPSRRRFLRTTGGVAAAAALAGCTGGDQTDESEATETTATDETTGGFDADGENVLQLINASMTSLDPVKAQDTASSEVTGQIYDGLLNFPDGGVPVEALLATDYERSEDFTTYTFHLKEGVSFHDGGEVTAQDVVYSWERLAASENSLAADDILEAVGVRHDTDDEGAYVPGSMAVEAVDDYTVRMEIEQPFSSALQVLANNQFAVVPEGIVGDVEGYDGEIDYQEFATSEPVGAGPFTFESWEPETAAVVSAYDDYHGSGPAVDGIHWSIATDPNARYNYAMNENADAFEIPTSQYDQSKVTVENTDEKGRDTGTYGPVRNGEVLDYESVVTLNVFYIGFNTNRVEHPARKATAYALNQHSVIDRVFKGRGEAAYHYTAPSVYPGGKPAYDEHASQNYPYGYDETALDEARRVMEEAGYGPDDRYEFQLLAYESSNAWQEVGQLLRDKLTSAHIDLTLEVAPFSTLLKRIRNSNADAYTTGWLVPWAAPDAFVKHLNPATSDPAGDAPESFTAWSPDTESGQRAVEAWERLQNNPEPTDEAEQIRNEAAITMEEANWEQVAALPVYHQSEERFSYQWADFPTFGAGGTSKQKFNDVTLDERS